MSSPEVEIAGTAGSVQAPSQAAVLEIVVLYTDTPSTISALQTAAQLAQGLTARIRLLVPHCVPYPAELDSPPVSLEFLDHQFRALVDSCPIETVVDIRLCREVSDTVSTLLPPRSVVVIGKRSRWWPRLEDRLARRLRAAGHHIVRTRLQLENAHA